MSSIQVSALYKFVALPQFRTLRDELQILCDTNQVKGILLVAHEGINGTLAGTPEAMERVLAGLHAVPELRDFEYKNSFCDKIPFLWMKVRLKKEIVTIGDDSVDPLTLVGTYVEPEDWNALISDPDVVVLDTRNDYEYRIGTFAHAIDPQTQHFGQFPTFVETHLAEAKGKKIAMFCTGGIRCEKASSYMLQQGYDQVFHLKGGILKYLERIPQEQSLWHGSCFVFDQRVSVGHGLEVSGLELCYGCRTPLEPEELLSPDYEKGVSCPHCAPRLSLKQRESNRMRQKQIELGHLHLG